MSKEKKPLPFKTKLIIWITAAVLTIAVIIGGVLWLVRDTDDLGPLDQDDMSVPGDNVGETPWDDF